MNLARAIRRDDDDRRLDRSHGAQLWNCDLEVRQQLEEESLELIVGAIEFVDEQDGHVARLVLQRLQERALDEKRLGEQPVGGACAVELVARFEQADLEELTRIVPLV